MPAVVNTFDNATVVANPNNYPVRNLAQSHDGSYAGHNAGTSLCNDVTILNPRICHNPDTDPSGVVIDYTYSPAIPAVTKLRLWNQGGFDLTDSDGFGQFDYEVFNSLNVSIASGTLVAGNGAAPYTEDVGLLQDVARVQIRNMTHLAGGADINGTWWREFETLTPDVDCVAADQITLTSARMRASGVEVAAGNFYQWEWSEFQGGPYDFKSDLVESTGANPEAISHVATALKPNTTYYYRVCIYDGDAFENPSNAQTSAAQTYNVTPICSEECSFTTLEGVAWCGTFYDPDDCVVVDPGNTEPYSNCNTV